jgi:hypothetical protein
MRGENTMMNLEYILCQKCNKRLISKGERCFCESEKDKVGEITR